MSRFKLIPAALLATTFLVFVPTTDAVGAVSLDSFQQCANGGFPSTATDCAEGWVNGNVNVSKAHFREDEVVPQRIAMNLTDGAEYSVTVSYMTRKGGKHTFDSLGTWNHTVSSANPCQGLTASLCTGPVSSLPMTSDTTAVPPVGAGIQPATNFHELDAADREWKMYGATLVSTGPVTHSNAANAGADDTASVTVRFKSSSASGGPAVLLFGGHIAVSGDASVPRAWGVNLGGSNASGSSYHISNSLGGGDNQIQAGSVKPLAPAAFTITKTVNGAASVDAAPGDALEYVVTVANTGQAAGATTFVDNFDDAIDPSAVTTDPAGGTCDEAGGQLSCQTSSIPGGGHQTFTYTAQVPASFDGSPGGTPCADSEFLVKNTATLANNQNASASVCVAAASAFTIEKSSDATGPVDPGTSVKYTITVTNAGSATGSTSFVDDFDDSIDPGAVTTDPTGGTCDEVDGTLECDTGSIAPGHTQTFTYSADMPDSFTGTPGDGCGDGEYPVVNTATLGDDSDSVTVCVTTAATFTVEKTSDADGPVEPGAPVEYTLTVKNTGTAPGSTSFTDDFDDSIDPGAVTTDPTGGSCDEVDGTLECDTSTIDPGDTQTFTYTADMPDAFTGESGGEPCADGQYPVVNTVQIGEDGPSDSAPVCVTAAPDFTIEKKADDTTAIPGQIVEYTITVTNNGSASGSTSFTDDYDDSLMPSTVTTDPTGGSCEAIAGTLDCDTSEIAAGGHQDFVYTAVMPASFTGAPGEGCANDGEYPIVNTVTMGDRHDDVTVCVATTSAFTVEKDSNADGPVEPGTPVEYTITVKNTGTAPGSTSFTDDFDSSIDPGAVTTDPVGGTCEEVDGTLECDTSSIDPGETQTFTYTADMPDTFADSPAEGCDAGGYPIVNTVTLGDDSDTETVCVTAAPDLVVEKTSDADGPVAPGTTVEYTVTVKNNGSAPGATTFTDDFDDSIDPSAVTSDPTGGTCQEAGGILTCTTGTIAAGGSQSFTYTADMPDTFSGTPDEGCADGEFPIQNTATLLTSSSIGVASETVCVTAAPEFTIEKTSDTTSTTPGQPVKYTVTVTNSGSLAGSTSFDDTSDVAIDPSSVTSDPAGGTCAALGDTGVTCETGSIEPGESQTFTYTVNMPESFTGSPADGCEDPTDYPVVDAVTLDGATPENESDDDSLTVCVDTESAFTVEKTSDVAEGETVKTGDSVEYTITVTNTGSEPGATTFTDDFDDSVDPSAATSDPEGGTCQEADGVLSCTTSSIDPGDTQTFTYTADMPDSFTGASGAEPCADGQYPVVNSVSLGDDGPADSVTVCVDASPDFSYEKSADPGTADPGDTVEYTITVTNDGDASGVATFTDDFDDSITPSDVTSDPSGGTCSPGTDPDNATLECTTGTILAGGHQTFTYTADMPETFEGAPNGTEPCSSYQVANRILVDGEEQAGETVCVDAAPAFEVDKTSDVAEGESASPGQTVHYTVTVRNTGSAPGATSFTDNFDDVLEPTLPESDPSGGSCEETTGDDRTFECDTSTIPAGASQTFTYSADMPLTFAGEPGTDEACGDDEYGIHNDVQIGDEGDSDGVVICVKAEPNLAVTKSVDDDTATPGQTVTYTLTVTNTGSAPGTIEFVDNFADELDPTVPASESEGGSCELLTDGDDARFSCDSGSVPAGGAKTFTYTADMPLTFTGASGADPCDPGQYPVDNRLIVGDDDPQVVTVCVTAAPDLSLVKTLQDHETDENGTEFLTYRLTYTNDGPAEAPTALIHDAIPDSTVFVSCSDDCDTAGSPTVTSADWAVGPVAPKGGTGSVTLTVRVTGNESCTVTNVATIQFGLGEPVSSNSVMTNVTPKGDPAGAHAIGNARGIQVLASGLLNLGGLQAPISLAATSQTGPGGPVLDDDSLLNIKVGSLVKADVLTTTSSSMVTPAPNEARHTATSEVGHVCILPVAGICTVEADAVRAVSSTTANGSTATVSSAGSTITRLRIAGIVTPVDLNQTTRIPLPAAVFGKNSFVTIGERSGPGVGAQPRAGLVGDAYMADQTVTMIHVKVTGLLGLQKAEVIVAQAASHSDYPKSLVCSGAVNRTVSGHALVAGLHTAPILENLLQGYVQISPLGGAESQHIAGVNVPANGKIVSALAGDSAAAGSINSTQSTAHAYAEIAGNTASPACILKTVSTCVVKATAIRTESRSTANASGASSVDSGTTIADLSVLGIPVTVTGEPNQVITVPGVGFIVINEQLCDNGVNTNTHTCSGATHSGLTVRGIRVFITVANNLLGITPGIDLVVSEAHSDATFEQAAS